MSFKAAKVIICKKNAKMSILQNNLRLFALYLY